MSSTTPPAHREGRGEREKRGGRDIAGARDERESTQHAIGGDKQIMVTEDEE